MCHPQHQLSLCTCTDIKKPDSHWSLKRFKDCDWMALETGRCLYPKYTDTNISTGQNIVEEFNNDNCFDFDFTPEEGDILNIVLSIADKKIPYEFIYNANQWHMKSSISSHMNKQYIAQKGHLK